MLIDMCGGSLSGVAIDKAIVPEYFEIHSKGPMPIWVQRGYPLAELILNQKVPTGEIWIVKGQEIIGKLVNVAPE